MYLRPPPPTTRHPLLLMDWAAVPSTEVFLMLLIYCLMFVPLFVRVVYFGSCFVMQLALFLIKMIVKLERTLRLTVFLASYDC